MFWRCVGVFCSWPPRSPAWRGEYAWYLSSSAVGAWHVLIASYLFVSCQQHGTVRWNMGVAHFSPATRHTAAWVERARHGSRGEIDGGTRRGMTGEGVDLLCVKGVQRGDGRGIGVGRCLRGRPLRAPVRFPVGHGGSVEGSLRMGASGVEAEARVNSFGGRCSDAGAGISDSWRGQDGARQGGGDRRARNRRTGCVDGSS